MKPTWRIVGFWDFEQIFCEILNQAANKKLIKPEHVFIDSTHVKASANKRKFEKKVVRKETKAYQERLNLEINRDREEHGKKPFPPDKFEKEERKEIKESTTTKEGYRQYVSNPLHCKDCPFLSRCTQSKNHQKVIQRHVWEEHMEEADHLRHTEENKIIYARRKETIERVFADAKEKHGMRWTTLRGIEKLSMQAMQNSLP